MGIETINDAEIERLRLLPKEVSNPSSRPVNKGSHIQQNFHLTSDCGQQFKLYVRGSKQAENAFSCGLLWMMPSGESLTLVRYNGSNHIHLNRLEKTEISHACHIHKATERYIRAKLKPEGFAEPTDRYSTLQQAIRAFAQEQNITGLADNIL